MFTRIVAALVLWDTSMAQAQVPPAAPKLAFEVASIRESKGTLEEIIAGAVSVGVRVQGTRVTFTHLALQTLIAQAYRVKKPMVVMPDDGKSLPIFDIVATIPDGSRSEQYPEMLKLLLSERFGLKAHREQRELAATVLTVSKNGHKLKAEPTGTPKNNRSVITGAAWRSEMTGDWDDIRYRMVEMPFSNEPFVDQTGLSGVFTGVIESLRVSGPDENGGYMGAMRASAMDSAERLGFKVEQRRMPIEVVVVDQINAQPSDN